MFYDKLLWWQLKILGIVKSCGKGMIIANMHNEANAAAKIIKCLADGGDVALISDAGTPLIHDPGSLLVSEVRKNGYEVCPIPGCCAAIAALSASGLLSNKFLFMGFLPVKEKARDTMLRDMQFEVKPVVLYEAPHRILKLVKSMLDIFGGERKIVIARELTKRYEQIVIASLADHEIFFRDSVIPEKGEFVVILSGYDQKKLKEQDKMFISTEDLLAKLLSSMTLRDAVRLTAEITGISVNKLYKRAISIQDDGTKS